MATFTDRQPIANSGNASSCRAPGMRGILWAGIACAGVNVTSAAGFDDISAVNLTYANASTSVVVNESRPKNVAVASPSNAATGTRALTPIDESDSPLCNEKKQPLCRDLAASEFQLTSLRFVLPEVRGLSPKSLNIRRNSISATYTFR